MFEYCFGDPEEEVFFAFSYPYSYEENQIDNAKREELYSNDKDVYFHRELLVKSCQGRNVDLITLSSHEGKSDTREAVFNEELFPERKSDSRAWKYL